MGNDEREVRLKKIEEIRKIGVFPYKDRFERNRTLLEAGGLAVGTENVRIAGRVMTIRKFGKLIFATLKDNTGKLQIALQAQEIEAGLFSFFKKYIDIGDFVGAAGSIFKTKLGEVTLDVGRFELLSKALRPLPEKWHGLQERELLYRRRYLDLCMNEGTLEKFEKRTRIIRAMRDYLDRHGFIEVETPVLQTKPSGAIATPFTTHHNALDLDLYLRIAPETYLKRCIAGGLDRVYEFARCFRNEGIDPSHLQDFTLLEWYAAFWNYSDNMKFTKELIADVVSAVNGKTEVTFGEKKIDFGGEWETWSVRDLLLRDAGIDIFQVEGGDERGLRKALDERGIEIEDSDKMGFGPLVDALYKKVSRPNLDGPVFLIHHPIGLSPLSRKNDEDARVTDRFQVVVNGWEIVNAYSELVDPVDQRERFETQAELRRRGDAEAMPVDEDFLEAMEYGMPPISGLGLGVDRFVALLLNEENLRDVILFPLMRPL
ncbi:MAG: lysine--tRNA ligase [Spirochaetes bacterium]|nr:lysine--tRNA ligase [Spirochaetota bacterium]